MDKDLILAILLAVKATVQAIFDSRPGQKLDVAEVLAAIDDKINSVDAIEEEVERILSGETE